MEAVRNSSDTILGFKCCYMDKPEACEYCPYFDEHASTNEYCFRILSNDAFYYLKTAYPEESNTNDEQPYLPGLERA